MSHTEHTYNPLDDAKVVWHMKTTQANPAIFNLTEHGSVALNQQLDGDDYLQSLKHGGDGFASVLDGKSWFSVDEDISKTLRPESNEISLYIRTWTESGGTLFFSDFMALALRSDGWVIGFLGTKTTTGKVFREMPLCIIDREGWLDLLVRVGNGKMDFFCNGILKCSIPINFGLCSPFDDELLIGGYMCDKPDGCYRWTSPEHLYKGKIDTVALWGHSLTDNQIALISNVESLSIPSKKEQIDQVVQDYNAFFDASINKDITSCSTLWESMCSLGKQDPWRPTYHLTQPFGCIFDPAGAYYYEGKYHVFSYRNIYSLLTYCSLDHYVSDDLIHWTEWPIAPWADNDLDVYAIYLMNHFIDDNGVPRILYTGQGKQGKYGILARSFDGLVSYEDKKAILTQYNHDGHIWKEDDTWYAITSKMYGGKDREDFGDAVMLWASPDLENWQEKGEIFAQPIYPDSSCFGDRDGFMEFPYLLFMGDKDVLMLGGHPVRYWVGRYDRQKFKFIPDKSHGQLLDYTNPFHCFNPLCVDMKGPGGTPRRIIMALYADIRGCFGGLPWSGVHAMPRLLKLEGDHLRQDPLPEMQSLRGDRYLRQNITVKPNTSGYVSKRGDTLEIIADFEPVDARRFGLELRVSQDRTSFVRVYFDTTTSEYCIDGRVPDSHGALNLAAGKGAPTYIGTGKPVRMHVFLDRLLVETFVNGQTCTTLATDINAKNIGLDLFCEEGTVQCTRLEIYDIASGNPSLRPVSF